MAGISRGYVRGTGAGASYAFLTGDHPGRKQVNDVKPISMMPAVRRTRRRSAPVELPDFFAMIDQQARMVVDLATAVGEVLHGKESAHSVRLLDLEQCRQELRRRNQAAVHSLLDLNGGVDEIERTLETLDRVAARLFRTAQGYGQMRSGLDEVSSRMMAVIQKATVSLQHGYTRLTNGSPAAASDAEEAIGSSDAVASYRVLALQERLQAPAHGLVQADSAAVPERTSAGPGFWLDELYGSLNDIAGELAGAGAILKAWSQRLSAGLHDKGARGDGIRSAAPHYFLAA